MDIIFKLRGETVTIPKYEYDIIFEEKWFISDLVKLNFDADNDGNGQNPVYELWEDKDVFISIIDSIRYKQILLNKSVTIEKFIAVATKWTAPEWLLRLAELKKNEICENLHQLVGVFECKNCNVGFKLSENKSTSCTFHKRNYNFNVSSWECCGKIKDCEGCSVGYHVPRIYDIRAYVDVVERITKLNSKLNNCCDIIEVD